jgi:hypothetical protein
MADEQNLIVMIFGLSATASVALSAWNGTKKVTFMGSIFPLALQIMGLVAVLMPKGDGRVWIFFWALLSLVCAWPLSRSRGGTSKMLAVALFIESAGGMILVFFG